VLEIKLRIRCPFPKCFERIAEELAILEARPKTWGFVPELGGNRADDVADRSEESGFAPMSPRLEEHMKGARRRSSLPNLLTESPAATLGDKLVARQISPCDDGLRAGAMRHHANGQLIAPEVPAQPVVRDLDFHVSLLR